MKKKVIFNAGLDIGSTTAKIAIIDKKNNIIFSDYKRHNTKMFEIIDVFFKEAFEQFGNCDIGLQITGSAGMGISEKTGIPFVQEVLATDSVIRNFYPEVKTLIDIGGEDSKMIFFNKNKLPDIRMNGSCAGGTGAFIDQIASLLNITPRGLNNKAINHKTIYPIASRCGVFAKTDVQNLISRKIPIEDIAASIFHAVSVQCLNTLARGFEIIPKIMLCGGPFTFLTEMSSIFVKAVKMSDSDLLIPEKPELLPALGAAIINKNEKNSNTIEEIILKLRDVKKSPLKANNRLVPLFKNSQEFKKWKNQNSNFIVKRVSLENYEKKACFLGIDSGSTTTKITVTGINDELLFSWYKNNHGNPVQAVIEGLDIFKKELSEKNQDIKILRSTVTGYGEDLIKAAFGIDKGVVETIAHYTAAKFVNPDVSFVLDIGGQDMKAIFINDGIINRIELNEACSSGCGSFIEMFGNSLKYSVSDFADMACKAEAPCDLGTRCTVFMNSKVKQSLRENASVEEISAGLSYSVIKNCLFKVLKLHNMKELGDNIVLQGGTFKNLSIIRALEHISEKNVRCSDIPELMGAYGASLISRYDYNKDTKLKSFFVGLENLEFAERYKTKQLYCKGCYNNCIITNFKFYNSNLFFSGNKCENFFTNRGEKVEKGINLFEFKRELLFDRKTIPDKKPLLTIGIPRGLNLYNNFPFWNTLFTSCGIEVRLSSHSTMQLSEKGLGTVMSDSICFPAKLIHGHIIDLVEKNVDRIFYPIIMYEKKEFSNSYNSLNCPIVSSYPDVITSAINPEKKYNIPLDIPTISFGDEILLKKSCYKYLKKFGISKSKVNRALKNAIQVQSEFRTSLRKKATELIERTKDKNELLIVLAGRPYHTDPLINHKTPEILSGLGAHVIPEDSIPIMDEDILKNIHVITQWAYPNRIFKSAEWVSKQSNNIQFVQVNSFGCGPDAIVTDEAREILKQRGKNYTLVKIDEITSTGSVKLRLRSMIEFLKLKENDIHVHFIKRKTTIPYQEKHRNRTILVPFFSECYSPFIPPIFELAGYNVINLPKPDRESVEVGLRCANHDICYPATIVIGDIIKALDSGNYNHDEIAIGITQTGGQCRASSYISLIKKIMVSAGYSHIPVISANTSEGLNDQPGFEIDWLKMIKILFTVTIYADVIAKMYYSTAVREKNKGESKKLHDKYINLSFDYFKTKDYQGFIKLIETAINEFNHVDVFMGDYPKIGIVGEIYIKYNSFGHQNIINWLIGQGIEVVVPPILEYFTQDFVNHKINIKSNIRRAKFSDILGTYLEIRANSFQKKVNKVFSKYRFYTPFHDIGDIAKEAGKVLSLVNQFGEGWLIPAGIATFADEGINNVVCLQPFGCIANQVISKGVEKRIKEVFPNTNLLFLDFDSGTSEVNVLNRLYFMMKNVVEKKSVA